MKQAEAMVSLHGPPEGDTGWGDENGGGGGTGTGKSSWDCFLCSALFSKLHRILTAVGNKLAYFKGHFGSQWRIGYKHKRTGQSGDN